MDKRTANGKETGQAAEPQWIWVERKKIKMSLLESIFLFLRSMISFNAALVLTVTCVMTYLGTGGFYGLVLALIVMVVLYIALKEQFDKLWGGLKLHYKISEHGIHYFWGVFSEKSLMIPFSKIESISIVKDKDKQFPTTTIYFSCVDKSILEQHQFFADDKIFLPCFEDIPKGQEVFDLLQHLHKDVKLVQEEQLGQIDAVYKYIPVWLNKLNLLIGFGFLIAGLNFVLTMVDFHMLPTQEVTTVITTQEFVTKYQGYSVASFETTDNHSFMSQYHKKMVGEEVQLGITPIFNLVNELKYSKYKKAVLVFNNYIGLSGMARLLTGFVLLISAIYILSKRGYFSLEDMGVVIAFPLGLLLASLFVLANM